MILTAEIINVSTFTRFVAGPCSKTFQSGEDVLSVLQRLGLRMMYV